MKKMYITSVLTLLLAVGCGARAHTGGPGYRTLPKGFHENGEAAVTVKEVDTGLGSGAVVDVQGYVITNYHVVSPKTFEVEEDGAKVKRTGTQRFEVCQIVGDTELCSPATVVKTDPKRDLALIKTDRTFPHSVAFRSEEEDLRPFDFVYSWANVSILLPVSPFRGRFVRDADPRRVPIRDKVLIFDLRMNPGGSGAPIFDRVGACVSIVSAGTNFRGGNVLTIGIPASQVMEFLEGTEAKFRVWKRQDE